MDNFLPSDSGVYLMNHKSKVALKGGRRFEEISDLLAILHGSLDRGVIFYIFVGRVQ